MSCGTKSSSSTIRISSGGGGGGGGGGRCSGGGGGGGRSGGYSSVSSRRYTSSGGGGGFSGRSFGGGGSRSSYGGGFSSGSCGRISRSSYGGRMSGGSYGGGMSCGSMGGGFGSGGGGFGGMGGGGYGGGGFSGFGGSGGFGGGGSYGGGSFGGMGFGEDSGLLSTNEKLTMQNLNDRLASYMDKVRRLEEENSQLEQLIREWYKNQAPSQSKDYSQYYRTIEELQKQVWCILTNLEQLLIGRALSSCKAPMTVDDFRLKYETEYTLHQSVASDINGLRPLLDQLTLSRSDLETQLESLQEELIFLRKNHEEEMRGLQGQSGGDVNVEVNATPGINLMEKLNEMRSEYERLIENNRKEVESWYETKMEEVTQQVHSSGQEIQSSNQQISELRREYQSLEIELQSQISMIDSLQSNLDDTERRYNMQLQQIQAMIGPLEEELASIRCEMEGQNEEYKMLLGIKTRLEQEIQQYRSLLQEGEDNFWHCLTCSAVQCCLLGSCSLMTFKWQSAID
uniref:Keratin, type I cytoskeletal 17 n=1 Tax=Cyanoderma ruficeps TaxID=181631 RepID=A0A8C3R6B9_9PASS